MAFPAMRMPWTAVRVRNSCQILHPLTAGLCLINALVDSGARYANDWQALQSVPWVAAQDQDSSSHCRHTPANSS